MFRRDRSEPAQEPVNPLAGLINVGERTVYLDSRRPGRTTQTQAITVDVFADKRSMKPRYYRWPNGALEEIIQGGSPDTKSETFTVRRHDPSRDGTTKTTTVERFEMDADTLDLHRRLGHDTRMLDRLMRRR